MVQPNKTCTDIKFQSETMSETTVVTMLVISRRTIVVGTMAM